jgi:hypothetical protein
VDDARATWLRFGSVAVLGRPPKGIAGVRFVTRSDSERVTLRPTELAVLEVLRTSSSLVDIDRAALQQTISRLTASGEVNLDRLRRAARTERSAGLTARLEMAIA